MRKRLAYKECRRYGYSRTVSAIKALLYPTHALCELYKDADFFWEGMPEDRQPEWREEK